MPSQNTRPAAPLAALASPNPALSVTALAVTGRAGVHLAAASAVPGAGFASRGIVKRSYGSSLSAVPLGLGRGSGRSDGSFVVAREGSMSPVARLDRERCERPLAV